METLWMQFMDVGRDRVINLIGAVAVLVLGWFIALVIAAAVRGLVQRTGLGAAMARWITGKESGLDPGKWIAKAVLYFLMLFVLVAFFQTLGLTIATEPLNQILVQISDFAPRILSAGILLVLAWVGAHFVKAIVSQLLTITRVDERLGESTGLKSRRSLSISSTVANAGYWLVFLLFLPMVLEALALEGLLGPVQEMLNKVLGFVPNIFAGGVILLVGWFTARIVQRIVTNLLSAAGIDGIGERVGLGQVLGKQSLSSLIGLIVYVFIIIPVAIAALDALQVAAISMPATRMLSKVFEALPAIFIAGFVLLVAYLVGRFVAGLVTKLLTGIGFNTALWRIGLGKESAKSQRTPSEVAGYLVLVGVILLAVIEAARLVGFAILAELLVQFISFAGQVLLGLAIFGFGLYLANLAARVIQERQAAQGGVLAVVTRISIVTLAAAMALRQMGLAHDIINMAFGLLLGSVAVAVALAFGLGSRDVAANQVEKWIQSLKGRRAS